ncbi:Fructokinase-2 [Platanthera zijinensis]|uniref:Fructokinase-2 n=1 Tax=Platanthera zijinensis TaxID=2320716 RepID=A0AAP0BJC5_9ASPA
MASLCFFFPLPFPRVHSSDYEHNIIQYNGVRFKKWCILAVSKKIFSQLDQQDSSVVESGEDSQKKVPRARRRKKMITDEALEKSLMDMAGSAKDMIEAPEKPASRGRKKANPSPSPVEGNTEKKVIKRKSRRKADVSEDQKMEPSKLSDAKEIIMSASVEDGVEKDETLLGDDDEEDISFTYSWPPLVCCFGAAQHSFIPSGRPANRLINHEIHKSMKDMFWTPTKFVRAPGSSPSSVAIAHAFIGGRSAFMGKLGDDEYGGTILYHLNVNKVQTRAIKIDSSRPTSLSQMKIYKRGGLKATCVKPCAEDSFLSSEINIDVLKEAKMFYFNSSSLLEQNTRSTAMEAIRISKKYGEVIFFDLNLALPLWKSSTETNMFIREAWNAANIIEVTKQELEFLCGIEPTEKFDTDDNEKSKFKHYEPEVVKQLWHDDLKVLFVTNGTSKIHYYTPSDNGFVRGMEDAPITPFTGDMSISGDAIVAALMRMLTVQPHLITDKGYLERVIKYAISCGVVDQWLVARIMGFPPKEGMHHSVKSGTRLMSISEKEFLTV